jgi:hypothetical protein
VSKWEDDLKLVKEAYPDLGEEFGSSIDGLIKGSASVGMDLYDKMTLPKTFGSTSPADLYEATGHIRTYPERFGEGLMKRDTSGTYALPTPEIEDARDFFLDDRDKGMIGPDVPASGYPHYSTKPSGEATMYDEDEWRRMIRESGRRPAPVAAAEVSPYMKISTGEDPEGSMRTTESYRGELSDEEAARFMAERDLSGIGIISPPIRTDVTDSGFIGKLKDMGSSSMPVYGGPGPTVEALPGETFTDIGIALGPWDAYAKGMEARYLSGELGIEPLGRGADGYVWEGMPGTDTYTGSLPTLDERLDTPTDSIFTGEEYEVASLGDASAFEPKFGDPGVEVAEDAYWEDLIARGLPTETTPDPTPLIDAVSGKTDLSPSEKLAIGIYGTPDAEMRSATAPLYRDTFVEDFIGSPFGALIPAGRSAMEGKSPVEWSAMDYVDLGLTAAGLPSSKSITKPVAGFVRSEWDKLREILKPTVYADEATDSYGAKKAIDKSWEESRYGTEDPFAVREEIISDGRLLGDYPMGPLPIGTKYPETAKMDVLGFLGEVPTGIYDASDLARIKATAAAKAGMTVPEFTVMYDRVKPAGELGLDDYIINTAKVPASVSELGAAIHGAAIKPKGVAKELITSPYATGAAKAATLTSLGYSSDPDDFSSMYIPSGLPSYMKYDYEGVLHDTRMFAPSPPGYDWRTGTFAGGDRLEALEKRKAEDASRLAEARARMASIPAGFVGGPEREITYIDATGGRSSPLGGVGDYSSTGTVTSPLTGVGGFYAPIMPHTGIPTPYVDPFPGMADPTWSG